MGHRDAHLCEEHVNDHFVAFVQDVLNIILGVWNSKDSRCTLVIVNVQILRFYLPIELNLAEQRFCFNHESARGFPPEYAVV